MSRALGNMILVTLVLVAIASQAMGSCSQFGHSCFGAHGKRNGGEQFQNLGSVAALYPQANQMTGFELKSQEENLPLDDDASSVTNPEIVANVRNWLAVLGRRLRKRQSASASSQGSPSALQLGFLQ